MPARSASSSGVSGAVPLERAVEPELDAEVDGEQLERAERGAEQALGERVGAIGHVGLLADGRCGEQRARGGLRLRLRRRYRLGSGQGILRRG